MLLAVGASSGVAAQAAQAVDQLDTRALELVDPDQAADGTAAAGLRRSGCLRVVPGVGRDLGLETPDLLAQRASHRRLR